MVQATDLYIHEVRMVVQGTIATIHYAFQDISPIGLFLSWPKLGRMLLCLALSTIGTILNGFYVAAFFIEGSLKKLGNVFFCCLGLADLAVTAVVIPISVIVLLSGEGDNSTTCRYQQLIVTGSMYAYTMFYMLVSAENYYRICHCKRRYSPLTSLRVGVVAIAVIVLSGALAAAGTYLKLDYDFCERLHSGNVYYRGTTAILFYLIPCLLTKFYLVGAAFKVRKQARGTHYRRSQQYDQDSAHATHNIIAYVVFVAAWAPYLIAIYAYPNIDNEKFYSLAWVGVVRSVFSSAIYSLVNRSFRRAYAHLFNYCCCKSTLSNSFTGRHRRGIENRAPTTDTRVNLMVSALNVHSPRRPTTANRDTQEL